VVEIVNCIQHVPQTKHKHYLHFCHKSIEGSEVKLEGRIQDGLWGAASKSKHFAHMSHYSRRTMPLVTRRPGN